MAKETIIKGRSCRWFIDGGIWVTSDGTFAARPTFVKGKKKVEKILTDSQGKYVYNVYGHRISIALAVITCFCAPPPDTLTGKIRIKHKDGNKLNCDKSNLMWEEYHYHHNPDPTATIDWNGHLLTIHRDGRIFEGVNEKNISDCMGDADTDLMVCIPPHIALPKRDHWSSEHVNVDELMKIAGYVQGDDAGMRNPVILHQDYDQMNFDSSNLEWVESSDPRYSEYQTTVQQTIKRRMKELNPGKQLPSWWT